MGISSLEDEKVDSISKWTGIPVDVVREYRQIRTNEAILRFLPEDSKKKLLARGYTFDPQNEDDKLNCAFLSIAFIGSYKDDFYRTVEGRSWYDCNFPNKARDSAFVQMRIEEHRRNLMRGLRTTPGFGLRLKPCI